MLTHGSDDPQMAPSRNSAASDPRSSKRKFVFFEPPTDVPQEPPPMPAMLVRELTPEELLARAEALRRRQPNDIRLWLYRARRTASEIVEDTRELLIPAVLEATQKLSHEASVRTRAATRVVGANTSALASTVAARTKGAAAAASDWGAERLPFKLAPAAAFQLPRRARWAMAAAVAVVAALSGYALRSSPDPGIAAEPVTAEAAPLATPTGDGEAHPVGRTLQEAKQAEPGPVRGLASSDADAANTPPAPAPAAAAAAPSATRRGARPFIGTLVVASSPRGARVSVDGVERGEAPVAIHRLEAGSHIVSLDLPGYKRWAWSVNVQAHRETKVSVDLIREPIAKAEPSP